MKRPRPIPDRTDERVLLLALRGRDAEIIEALLTRHGQASLTCASADALAKALGEGAGTALITEESLTGADRRALEAWLSTQEPWSDFPFILLATKRVGQRPREAASVLEALGNVVVLERPIHSETLASAVNASLRVRRRQYEARGRLHALKAAEDRLTQLNASLESRIAERTTELSRANNRLMEEIAARERAQAALVQSQKVDAIGQLTGGIAHDFNNLLTVIAGNLDLIERRTVDEKVATYASHASKAAGRAAKLTHQLLAFSRTQQLTLEPVDLNALVEGMKDLLDRTIGPHVQKQQQLSPAPLWVMADANQLELAVLNLAINARDAMPERGVLRIETWVADQPAEGLPPGAYGVVTVADTGCGIPPKLLSRVFDPFFTTKPLGKGTGLGLSQVFGIARQSGGTATIDSTEGAGTAVSVWLPVTPAPSAEPDVAADAPGREPARGRILIVDDDDGVRLFLAESLQVLGYSVQDAPSGPRGLDHHAAETFDLVIVDFAMEGMNGGELATHAKALKPHVPVVLATGYAEIEDHAPMDAIDAVLRKPFSVDDLATVVRQLLARTPN